MSQLQVRESGVNFQATHGRAGPGHHAMLWLAIVIIVWLSWTGFQASDDAYYVMSGLGWAHNFPYVATYFATARAVVGISMAPFIAIFGENEFTIVLSSCVYFGATASLTLHFLSRLTGAIPATVACAIMCTVPLLALKSTTPSADLPELFFVAASFWLFWMAIQRERRFWMLISAGACAAFAFSAHETAVALLLFYGVLFLVGFGISRREYWVMAIGFLAIVGLESAYYALVAGDPFHRLSMLFRAVSGGGGDRVEVGFLEFAAGGTLHVSVYLDPLLMFFFKQEFALLGIVAVPALWWGWVTMRGDRTLPVVTARLLAILGVVWFLFAAIWLRNLILLPRYYMVTAYCLFVVVAIWASTDVWRRRRILAIVGSALFVLANLAAIYVDNRNPRFAERALVEYLGVSSGPVYTDPLTAHNADWFCRWAKQDCTRVKAGPPEPNRAYFYNPRNADRPTRLVRPEEVRLFQPSARWHEVWRKEESNKVTGMIVETLGLARLLPARFVSKLNRPNPDVKVFRASE